MASNPKPVNPKTVERLLGITYRPPPRPTPRATTRPTPRATARPTPRATARPTPRATARPTPRATAPILRLNGDILRKIAETYSEMVNKPKEIAEKLVEATKKSEKSKVKNILETITDIKRLAEIRRIISDNYDDGTEKLTDLILLIMSKNIELLVVKKQQEKLRVLKVKVIAFKHNLRVLKDTGYKYNFDIREILESGYDIVRKLKIEQDKANNILTPNYIKTLPENIHERQNSIEKSISECESKMNELLNYGYDIIAIPK